MKNNAYVSRQSDHDSSGDQDRTHRMPKKPEKRPGRPIGLALSGGGSRAIAFHLGCLRALNDNELLDKIDVISGVSGGSVIAAMYAYSQNSFEEFEAEVVRLLRRGLLRAIAREFFVSPRTAVYILSFLIAVPSAIILDAISFILRLLHGADTKNPLLDWVYRIRLPMRRWKNTTDAFERALRRVIFDDTLLTDERRDDVHIVLNACDLSTGTAFRFSNLESGCSRLGSIKDNSTIEVAEAVAASAAFPAFLPALERKYVFIDRDGTEETKLRFLADGGVYDNLGLSCFDPGITQEYSHNVFHPGYIVCSSAGHGIFDDDAIPRWWFPRMNSSFSSIYRKFEDSGKKDLHQFKDSRKIKGFVLSLLGQLDEKIFQDDPIHEDFIKREEVYNYPTNFSSMSQEDIEKISGRGRQLTETLVSRHFKELLP